MDHFEKIYAQKARMYHTMIDAEDADGNLLPALQAAAPMDGKRVLDLGSGTGRVTLLLHKMASKLVALDLNFPMLVEQSVQRQKIGGDWPLINGDMRWLPFEEASYDVVIAGWAIGHLRSWFETDWKDQMGLIFSEMERMVVAGGSVIVLETMTTGSTIPAPPTEGLAEYYDWMEGHWGFSRRVIQTDYQFNDIEQAVAYTEFFFGDDLAKAIRKNQWVRLPEWTGIWHKAK